MEKLQYSIEVFQILIIISVIKLEQHNKKVNTVNTKVD
jgi:hypothetical protein